MKISPSHIAIISMAFAIAGQAYGQNIDGRIRGFANNQNKVLITKGSAETSRLVPIDAGQSNNDIAAFQKEVSEDIRRREDENVAWLFWRDGKLIQESYHPKVNADNYFLGFSITKSLISIAVGSAMCEGKLSLSDLASKYLPELSESAYANRTIEDLLKMTSGIPFSENPNAETLFRAVLSQNETYDLTLLSMKASDYPPKRAPAFNYDSNHTEVLGRVLQAVSGGTDKYLAETFWSKIGAQSDAWFAVDRQKRLMTAGGLYAQPKDYLRVGIHFLNLLDDSNPQACIRDFARRAASPITTINWGNNYGYGYQIWSRNKRVRNNDGVFELNGLFGQRIVVDPKTRSVAVALSTREGDLDRFYALVNKLRTIPIQPAAQSK